MTLKKVIEDMRLKGCKGSLEAEITGITHDSRIVDVGKVFVALRGRHFDGHTFIGEAAARGASAVVCDDERLCGGVDGPTLILVDDSREALARLASNFYGRPSEELIVIGVTGTNGKTTTTRIIKSILETSVIKTGLVGTIGYVVGPRTTPASHTTPESADFQRLLREMRAEGCTHVVCEVSSHALSQKRVDCTRFGAAVFTNLTRDHLDFHADMEEYFSAKRKLFRELLHGPSIINIDDPYGVRLADSAGGETVTYSVGGPADLSAVEVSTDAEGLSFKLAYKGSMHAVSSRLIGRPNVYNILAAAGACLSLGVSVDAVIRGIMHAQPVEGRFQKVELGQDFLCIVDYAHTEDALRNLLLTAREFTRGRLITVFGCGGDRDAGKRPAMGAAATELSDLVFITSDNPRSEDPREIIEQIVRGTDKDNFKTEADRAGAIRRAIGEARAGDTVVLAGKGHEEYQEINGRRHHFNDAEEAARVIREQIVRRS